MFGIFKQFLSYRLASIFIFVAVLTKLYQKEIVGLISQYLDNDNGESIAVQFTDADAPIDKLGSLFTSKQLATYNGENGASIYLALLGTVFDVTRGLKHYGPGCSYNFFVGRDASVSFVSGQFDHYDPDTADDVLSLKSSDLLQLAGWLQFYEKEYEYKGKLIGRFYDDQGKSTAYHKKYLAMLDQALIDKAAVDELRNKYPGCNIEWSEATGTRVWCTTTSGDGKERDWVGYPRKLYNRDKMKFHCACVPEAELNDPMFKSYEDCLPHSNECFYRV